MADRSRLARAPQQLRDIASDIRDRHALSARILTLIADDVAALASTASRGTLTQLQPAPDLGDYDPPELQHPAGTCGIPVELAGCYPCAVELDGDGGHDGDCLTQPELDGTWPPRETTVVAPEDAVIGLSTVLFDLVHQWTSLLPDQRTRVNPAIVPILDALQRRCFAELKHAIDTPDDEPAPT